MVLKRIPSPPQHVHLAAPQVHVRIRQPWEVQRPALPEVCSSVVLPEIGEASGREGPRCQEHAGDGHVYAAPGNGEVGLADGEKAVPWRDKLRQLLEVRLVG